MASALRAAVAVHPAAGPDDAGLALAATMLWSRVLRFDAADPSWPDRDRFVVSAARYSMLLYGLLHLTGHDGMGSGMLRRLARPNGAAAPAALGLHPAIEATAGPPGQGLAMGAGLALAERIQSARFGRSLVDHRTWVLACETDLAAGVAQEAAALAGQMRLDRLVVLFEENAPHADDAGDGVQDIQEAQTELHLARFAACGWAVRRVMADDAAQLGAAFAAALRARKPTLIACRPGRPTTRTDPLPDRAALAAWLAAGERGRTARRGWLKRMMRHRQRDDFAAAPEDAGSGPAEPGLAAGIAEAVPAMMPDRMVTALPALVALSAGRPERRSGGRARLVALDAADGLAGRHIVCGTQEHGMAALLNGVVLHGGLKGCGFASFMSIDRMRIALRMAALMGLGAIHVLSQDDSPHAAEGAWQPVEQLASLRAMPNVMVFRPGTANELRLCWQAALRRTAGPSVLALPAMALPACDVHAEAQAALGGYVASPASGPLQATLIATGTELSVALAAQTLLHRAGIAVAVVSLPCWELFAAQGASYRHEVLGTAVRLGIEAASGFGWERWLGPDGVFIGRDDFDAVSDAAAAGPVITPQRIAEAVRSRLGLALEPERPF